MLTFSMKCNRGLPMVNSSSNCRLGCCWFFWQGWIIRLWFLPLLGWLERKPVRASEYYLSALIEKSTRWQLSLLQGAFTTTNSTRLESDEWAEALCTHAGVELIAKNTVVWSFTRKFGTGQGKGYVIEACFCKQGQTMSPDFFIHVCSL